MQKTCLNCAHVAHDGELPLSCRHIGPQRDRCTPRCMCAPNDSCWARRFTSRPHGGSGQHPPRQDDETGRESRASGMSAKPKHEISILAEMSPQKIGKTKLLSMHGKCIENFSCWNSATRRGREIAPRSPHFGLRLEPAPGWNFQRR